MVIEGIIVEGEDRLIKQFKALGESVKGSQPERLFLRAAKVIRDNAKERAPLGPTGNLRKGIVAKLLDRRGRRVAPAMAGINFRRAPHAHLVEFGTVKMSPRPFFRPAVIASKERVNKIIVGGFKRIFAKVARQGGLQRAIGRL